MRGNTKYSIAKKKREKGKEKREKREEKKGEEKKILPDFLF